MSKNEMDMVKTVRTGKRMQLLRDTGRFLGAVCFGMMLGAQAYAADQIVDTNAAAANQAQMTETLNHTPVENIAAPNAAGLSHNKFSQFNVGTQGLVINNSSVNVSSKIGGALVANPNLVGGEATKILNEVTGSSRSQLNGTQELVGGRADYILANPNGITCDGCGFINFPRATLTTGKPVLSSGGDLTGFNVTGGDIAIESLGLNASQADAFDVITRAMTINGQINANTLRLTAGCNSVDYASGTATAQACSGGSAPSFALDSTALGGMYAGRISLVGTEAGVGVRMLGDMAASVDDINLDVNGKISFSGNKVVAQRDITLKSRQAAATAGDELALNDTTLYANRNTTLDAGDIALSGGRTGASNNLSITARNYTDTGTTAGAGLRDAGNDLTLTASGTLSADSSTLQAGHNAKFMASSATVQNGAQLIGSTAGSTGDLNVAVTNGLTLTAGALGSGNTATISANTLSLDAASNAGGAKGIHSTGAATINATSSVSNSGFIGGDAGLTVTTGTLTQQSGSTMLSGGATSVNATTLDNAGYLGGDGSLTVKADTLLNRPTGVMSSAGAVSLSPNTSAGSSLSNHVGGVIKGDTLTVNNFASVGNDGTLYGATSATVTTPYLSNSSSGLIASPGTLTLGQSAAGGSLANNGNVEAGILDLTFDTVNNNAGEIYAATSGTLKVDSLTNASKILSDVSLSISDPVSGSGVNSFNNTATGVVNAGKLYLGYSNVTNDNTIYSSIWTHAVLGTLTNHGAVQSGGDIELSVYTLNNIPSTTYAADIVAYNNLSITGNNVLVNKVANNLRPRLVAQNGALTIDASGTNSNTQNAENDGGLLFAGNGLNIYVARQFINQASGGHAGYVFANAGTMNLGAKTNALLLGSAQDVTVSNIDSQIENNTGDINIIASYFYNKPSAYTPLKSATITQYSSGSVDYTGNGDVISVYSGCTSYNTVFDEYALGTICATSYTVTTEQLTNPDAGLRSKLVAGGNINLYIEKAALNYISLMSAAKNLSITGLSTSSSAPTTFENKGVTLKTHTTASVYRWDEGAVDAACGNKCFWDRLNNGYGIDDGLLHDKKFTPITTNIPDTYTTAVDSTVEAGAGIYLYGNLSVLNNNDDIGTKKGSQAGSGQTTSGPTAPGTSSTTIGTQDLSSPVMSAISVLSDNPLFVATNSPTSPYLYETDPSLISLAGLYSSDLFLTSLGLDPESYRRVGDAYYEQQLLREQLLAQAGQRFIENGMADENDQYKYLLDNGVQAKKNLQLTVGVALTADQVNSLQKDIVWMVEKVVDGQKVLVPQLYLCSTTRAKLAHGAKFVASNITINTEGPVTNSGAFVASNDINVKTGSSFTNHLGTITAGNDLDIHAKDNITNESGHIKGNNVSLTSDTGSVINKTLTHDVKVTGSLGSGTDTRVGDTATIEAGNNLNIHAHDDVVSEGGKLKAGNDANLTADTGDVTLKGIEKKSYKDSIKGSQANGETTRETSRSQETTNVGSSLQVGGNLSTSAGQDININGSSVDVKGNAKLHAGGDINIAAAAETSHTETSSNDSGALHHSSDKTTVDQTTGAASSLGVGGNLTIDSGGDTNVVGSDVSVDGDMNVKNIGGDLNVTTFKNKTTVHNEHKQSSVFGGGSASAKKEGDAASSYTASASGTLYQNSSKTTDIKSTKNRGSSITVGGNLNAGNDAIKGDANITGSTIATGGDMNLSAKGDVNVMAAHDTTTMHQTSHSDQFNVNASASVDGAKAGFGETHNDSNGTASQSTAQVSSLSSGGNMNIHAGGDFTEEGTKVKSGGDINIDASSVNSKAAQDTYSETGDSLSVETSLGVHADTGLGGVVDSFVDKNGKAKFDGAGAADSVGGLSAPDAGSVGAELSVTVTKTKTGKNGHNATASSFTSGGNVNITARDGDATFHGTNVDAGGSINVNADKGSVNVLTADSGENSHKDTTTATVTVGVTADGSISGDGSGGTSHDDAANTSQAAASFKAGKDVNLNAKKDVTMVGTKIKSKGNVTVAATEGKIDYKAARDTTNSNSNSNNTSAGVTVGEASGGVRGGHEESRSHSDSSTGHAGSISGANITLKSKGDISLEGTNLDSKGDVNLQTKGKLDYSAVKDTSNSTTKGGGGHFDVSGGKTGGSVSGGGSSTDEEEHSVTRTGGSINAGHLNISTGDGGARLEGTKVKAGSANIDTGKGKLTIESAVSTHTKKVNDTSADVGVSADVKEHSGGASVKVDSQHEDTNQVKNSNASLDIGGKLDIKSGGGIDVKGKDVKGLGSVAKAGSTDTHGAKVTVEQRHDVNKSKKSSTHVSVGVVVPSKKVRNKVKKQVSHSKVGHHAKQKLATAKSHVSNAASKVHTKAKNAASSVKTRVKNHGADATTRAANKKAHKETKHANNTKLAEKVRTHKDKARDTKRNNATKRANRKADKAQAKITEKQKRKDQKADYDRQKADNKAQKEHDKKLAALGDNATQSQKDHLNSQLTSRKKQNASQAANAKKQNATDAAQARQTAHDKHAQRKHEIEDKTAASKTRHTDEAANKKIALADKLTDNSAKETHKKQATDEQKRRNKDTESTKVRDKAQHTVEHDTAQADARAQKTRQHADLNSQAKADREHIKIDAEKTKREQAVDNDTSLTPEQKTKRKQEIEQEAETKKAAVDAKLAKSKKNHAEAGSDYMKVATAKAEKKRTETVSNHERDQKHADLDAKHDAGKAKAKSERDQTREHADTQHEVEVRKANEDHKHAVRKADERLTRKKAEAEERHTNADAQSKQEYRDKRKAINADSSLTDVQKKRRLKKARKDYKDAKAENQKKFDSETARADEQHQKAIDRADQRKRESIANANTVRDATYKSAKKKYRKTKDELQAKRDQAKSHANEDADRKVRQSDAEVAKQQALSDASKKKRRDDRAVERNGSMDASAKADAHKANAEAHADAVAQAKKQHADEQARISKEQDRADRKREEAKVDNSNLTDAEKQKRKAEIDAKYADRDQYRRDLRHNRKQQADAEATHAKDVASAEHQHRKDVIKADQDLQTAKDKAARDKARADRRADRKKAQQEAALAARTGLSDKQRERRQKRIDERHKERLAKNAADHDEAVKHAESEHDKAKKKAQDDLDNKIARADTTLEHTQSKLKAKADKLHADAASNEAKHQAIHDSFNEKQKAAAKERDRKIEDASKEHAQAIEKANGNYKESVQKADEKLADKQREAHDKRLAEDEAARRKFDEAKTAIEENADLTDSERQDQIKQKEEERDATLAQNAADERAAKKSAIKRHKRSLDHAKSKRDQAIVDADKAKRRSVRHAKRDHGKKEADRASEHAQDVAHANAKSEADRKLSKEKRKQQVALADAEHKKKTEDARVENDDSLSDTEKANRLKQNAETYAGERAQAQKKIADAERDAANEHADHERNREKDLVDRNPDLTADQKLEEKSKIDAKYHRRKQLNDAEHTARVSEIGAAKAHAEKTASIEHDHSTAITKAEDDKKTRDTDAETEKQNAENALDPNADDYAQKKQEIEDEYQRKLAHSKATHDLDVRKADAEARMKREQADAQKRKADALTKAELGKKRALNDVESDDTLTIAQKDKRRRKINKQYEDATEKADERYNASNDASEARNEQAQAEITRERADADVDADASLSEKEKAAAKKENAKTAATAEKAAQKKLATSEKKLDKLMTPEEKAAKASAQATEDDNGKSAKDSDGKVKNPYSRKAKFNRHVVAPTKRFVVKAERWKQILTSIGVTVTHPLPQTPQAQEEEPDLLALMNDVKNLPPGQQAAAMRTLRDPDVRAAAAVSTALESRHQALEQQKAEELARSVGVDLSRGGVLTSKDQRKILAQHGVNVSQGASMAEVRRQYDAFVSKQTVDPPLSVQEKEQMLEALGHKKETKAANINKAFSQVLSKGETQFKSLTNGLPADQVNALHQGLLQAQP